MLSGTASAAAGAAGGGSASVMLLRFFSIAASSAMSGVKFGGGRVAGEAAGSQRRGSVGQKAGESWTLQGTKSRGRSKVTDLSRVFNTMDIKS